MTVKTRMQGNSVSATFPKYLGIKAGVELEPIKTKEGILFKFVRKDTEDFNFDRFILRDLMAEGYEGEALIAEFENRKANIPKALDQLTKNALEAEPTSKEELLGELGI